MGGYGLLRDDDEEYTPTLFSSTKEEASDNQTTKLFELLDKPISAIKSNSNKKKNFEHLDLPGPRRFNSFREARRAHHEKRKRSANKGYLGEEEEDEEFLIDEEEGEAFVNREPTTGSRRRSSRLRSKGRTNYSQFLME